MARLEAFSDGTPEGRRTLVDIFLTDVAETTGALAAAVSAQHHGEIAQLAHRAGGASAACGANGLAAILLALEDVGRAGGGAGSVALMREVTAELERVSVYLRAYRNGTTESA